MFKISKEHSVMLSIVLAIIFFVGCVVGAFFMPKLSYTLLMINDLILPSLGTYAPNLTFAVVLVLAYLILAIAMFADVQLFFLLLRVRKGLVFTEKSTSIVRGISWCLFLLAAVFFALGIYFQLSFIVAFAAAFLGICLRVVKNVLEEATEIKCENDLTV